ncbi:OB-fold protein [Mammaliicoccus sciuri]|uniref:OB-fold protein n=1 Tax=Mammaliicoccus sciuri TaxID=1296 RepID=UPI002DBD129B|nr:hypothetical protein [Mammaliicoccus sciuri]MEB6258306.1 hypothetical protein [Mammaliicoccus sciuri]MEB8190069.1 hypothetical protein [Mammaliicoccus sciuri]
MHKKNSFKNNLNKKPSWMKSIITIIFIVVCVFIFLLIIGALLSPNEESEESQNTTKQEKSKDDNENQTEDKNNESDEESEEYKKKHKFMNTPKENFNVLNEENIKDIQRNPKVYVDKPYKISGTVIQVSEGDIYNDYRIALNDDYDNVVLVEIVALTDENRILEDDIVTVYSQYEGLTTYESVSGSDITIPKFFSDRDMIKVE